MAAQYFEVPSRTPVYLHEAADVSSPALEQLQPGTTVRGDARDGDWLHVPAGPDAANSRAGWVLVSRRKEEVLLPVEMPEHNQEMEVIRMQQKIKELEAQLQEKSRQAEERREQVKPRLQAKRPGRFTVWAMQQGAPPKGEAQQADAGQLYEVVHRPRVAVRRFPSLDAEVVRCASTGCRLTLFEWDGTRTWRRCRVWRAVDRRQDAEAPGFAVPTDAWVMVEHPDLGVLLQAVLPGQEAGGDDAGAGPLEVPEAEPNAQPFAEFEKLVRAKVALTLNQADHVDRQEQEQAALLPQLFPGRLTALSDRHADAARDGATDDADPAVYRVVYKTVPVMAQPDARGEVLGHAKLGEEIYMYKWDPSRIWRQVRVEIGNSADKSTEEVLAWMMVFSDKIGPLLQEIPKAEPGEEEEDEMAG